MDPFKTIYESVDFSMNNDNIKDSTNDKVIDVTKLYQRETFNNPKQSKIKNIILLFAFLILLFLLFNFF